MVKVRAGSFSAALSSDQQLFVWGRGVFGEFYTPHRVKSVNKLDMLDFQLSKGGIALILTRHGTVYSWGANDFGQLGHGDYKTRATPERIDALDGKRVTQLAVGHEFVVALGLTMPQREYEKAASKKNQSILRQQPSSKQPSGSKSTRNRTGRTKTSRTRKDMEFRGPASLGGGGLVSDFNKTSYSSSKISFKDPNRRRDGGSGDRGKFKDMQALLGPKTYKKSKSSSRLLPSASGASRAQRKAAKDTHSSRLSQSQRKSPIRSARGTAKDRSASGRSGRSQQYAQAET